MARSMVLDVLVRLKDLLSSPLRGLRRNLQGIVDMSRKIGLVGTAIAAISFMGPINQAAAFQQKLLDIAGTANLSGRAAFSFIDQAKGQYEELAFVVGQYSDTIASGAGQMIAAGVDKKLIDASIGDIGRTATAANAEFSDMAGVATSLLTTLRVPANELRDSMGALVVSGKEGAFELKDMARYFPTLTGQMAKFGVTGREAVNFLGTALQIARKGTSDPAEAANNLKNFLSKILAPATIKNFKDAGVDIEAVMRDAATKGINPIEAVMQKIVKLTGTSDKEIAGLLQTAKKNGLEGADALGFVREQLEAIHGAGALGNLFADQQVMDFIIPFLGNLDEYKRIKDEVSRATGAVIDTDFETQMQGLNRQLTIFNEIGAQAGREVGLAFGTWLPVINGYLSEAVRWYREFDRETDGFGKAALSAAGGGTLLASAIGAVAFVAPYVASGLSLLLSPVRLLAQGGMILATALAGPALAALTAIGGVLASISAPIWAVVAAIAAVAVAIYRYWEPISNWVSGFASGVAEALAVPLAAMEDFNAKVKAWAGEKLLDFAKWIGLDEETINSVTGRLGGFADTVVQKIKAIPSMVGNFLSELFTMKDYSSEAETAFNEAGKRAGIAFVNAFKDMFIGLFEWFKGLPDRIVAAIGQIDLSSIMPDWNSLLPKSLFGSSPAAEPSNDNAPGQSSEQGQAPAPAATSPGAAAPAQKRAQLAPAVAPVQRVQFASANGLPQDLGGTIHITADPGLKVASAVPNDRSMKFEKANTGRAIGRV